jgi:hypothetical protein
MRYEMTSTEIADKVGKMVEGERVGNIFEALVAVIAHVIAEHCPDSEQEAALDDVIAELRVCLPRRTNQAVN